jgi:hypothetical protein
LKRVQLFRLSLSGGEADVTTAGGQGATIVAGIGLFAWSTLDARTGLESTAATDGVGSPSADGAGSEGWELSAVQAIDSNRTDMIGPSFRFRTS